MNYYIQNFSEYRENSLQRIDESFILVKFNSHKNHNPGADIVEGKIDSDTIITYGIYVKDYAGIESGTEFMELYVGENYVVGSKKRSNSRYYPVDKIPPKYKKLWLELKEIYETKYINESSSVDISPKYYSVDENFWTNNKDQKDVYHRAIEYIIGAEVIRYHDEAKNYVYQIPKTNRWFTISKDEVDVFVQHHGGSLMKEEALNEGKEVDKAIEHVIRLSKNDIEDFFMLLSNYFNKRASSKNHDELYNIGQDDAVEIATNLLDIYKILKKNK